MAAAPSDPGQIAVGRPASAHAPSTRAVREIGGHVGIATPNVDALFGLVRLMAATRGLGAAAPPALPGA